jgi:gluconate 5-dehydrogenase
VTYVTDLFSLSGRVALVTGGSSGIGQEMARALALAGARVVLVARDKVRLTVAADTIRAAGGDVAWVAADLAVRESVARAAGEAAAVGCRLAAHALNLIGARPVL